MARLIVQKTNRYFFPTAIAIKTEEYMVVCIDFLLKAVVFAFFLLNMIVVWIWFKMQKLWYILEDIIVYG